MTENSTIDVESAQRVTALEQSFRRLARGVPGMTIEVVGHMRGHRKLVHPVAGFTVRLQDETAGATLYVSSSYGELTLWRGPQMDGGAMRERFTVRLSEAFQWGDSEYPAADPLAADLLGYLQFNLDRMRGG